MRPDGTCPDESPSHDVAARPRRPARSRWRCGALAPAEASARRHQHGRAVPSPARPAVVRATASGTCSSSTSRTRATRRPGATRVRGAVPAPDAAAQGRAAQPLLRDRAQLPAQLRRPDLRSGPEPDHAADCQTSRRSRAPAPTRTGQARGHRLRLPGDRADPAAPADRRRADLAGLHAADAGRCQHPAIGALDPTQHATQGHNYAVRHNPFMYFRRSSTTERTAGTTSSAVAAEAGPAAHEHHAEPDLHHARPLPRRPRRALRRRPAGRAGHGRRVHARGGCRGSSTRRRSGKDGVLIITADESDRPQSTRRRAAASSPGPNSAGSGPGIAGPGGGRIGALVISRWSRRGTWSTTPYNHYSLLGSMEEHLLGCPSWAWPVRPDSTSSVSTSTTALPDQLTGPGRRYTRRLGT